MKKEIYISKFFIDRETSNSISRPIENTKRIKSRYMIFHVTQNSTIHNMTSFNFLGSLVNVFDILYVQIYAEKTKKKKKVTVL